MNDQMNNQMNDKERRKGKSASLSGSFNPLHFDHIGAINELFALGYDRVHLFVRDNPAEDIVPWEVKQGWFEKLVESYGGRVIFHRMPSVVRGKKYSSDIFVDMVKREDLMAGEDIHGFYFSCDHSSLVQDLIPRFPDKEFHIGNRGNGYSSTAIREDPEGHKNWMPDYVYESLLGRYI